MKATTLKYRIGCLGLGLFLIGCASTSVSSQPSMVQSLPIAAQTRIGGNLIQLEVARTPQQQEIGLMNRTKLANDRGMLFPFDPPRPVQFWMRNTLIPLDMLFLRNGVVAGIAQNVPPCKADPCPTYGDRNQDIDQVIELRGGRAAELGLKAGDRLAVQFVKK